MLHKNIDLMTNSQWINYREKLIDDFYSKGFVLKPNINCDTCDIDNEYICFTCECSQLEKE